MAGKYGLTGEGYDPRLYGITRRVGELVHAYRVHLDQSWLRAAEAVHLETLVRKAVRRNVLTRNEEREMLMLSDHDLIAFRNHPILKHVWRAGVLIGQARSWGEVAALMGDVREDAAAILSRENSEGPDDFTIRDKGG